jgi:hypothetical protein
VRVVFCTRGIIKILDTYGRNEGVDGMGVGVVSVLIEFWVRREDDGIGDGDGFGD